ncbi:MAG: carbohydrate ABC transporter permease [Exiguobacterium profundum]|nr:MAG: carbohydrate ABC transporter permease [Exiguobacterium profundum]
MKASQHARYKMGRFGVGVLFYAVIIGFCAVVLFPVYWMVVNSIQPLKYGMQFPPPLFPQEISFQPFTTLFQNFPVARWLLNSLILASMATVLVLALAVLGSFAMTFLKWRGKAAFGLLLLMTQMLPEALVVIPVYAMYRNLGLSDSLPALSLIDAAFILPICIWVLKNAFDSIAEEIYEAALIDGCTPLGALIRTLLPLSAPGLVAVSVVAFFYAWNEYLFAVTLITSPDNRPVAVGLASLKVMLDTPIDRVLAAALFFSIFPVIFYLIIQRYIVAGLSAGAVKG